MKNIKYVYLLYFFFTGFFIKAQERPTTLFDKINTEDVQITGFGGPILEWSQINGDLTFAVGGGGAVMLNNLFIGGYGIGVTNHPRKNIQNENLYFHFGHGGFWVGYELNPKKLVHLTISSKFGWGNASLSRRQFQNTDAYNFLYEDRVFVWTPEIGAEANITNFLKVGFTGGYRLVSGFDLEGYSPKDLDSLTGALTFKFGWFK